MHVHVSHSRTDHSLAVCGDNFSWLPDASIDLVLTDPPFNIARDTNFHTYDANTINSYRFDAGKGWDSYTPEDFIALLGDWALEFARVLRPGGSFAIFCADTYLSHLIDALGAAGLTTRRTLTWEKPNAVPINRQFLMMSACEYVVIGVKNGAGTFNPDVYFADPTNSLIEQVLVADKVASVVDKEVRAALGELTGSTTRQADVRSAVRRAITTATEKAVAKAAAMYITQDDVTYLRGCVPNHVSFNSKSGKRLHPTEKPVTLLSYLLELLSNPGDVVLDPFAGSGSTAEAASLLGRNAIVIEKDADFYALLTKRLSTLEKPTTPPARTP
jgi:site-specific DNA-methyltransferase (adenine-specific)